MKNKHQRWYEKHEHLNALINLLEGLPAEIQCEFAIEIILKASHLLDREYEKIIEDVAQYDPKNYKRWYDKNPNVHVAIESLKDLDDVGKDEIIKEFSEKILKYYSEADL